MTPVKGPFSPQSVMTHKLRVTALQLADELGRQTAVRSYGTGNACIANLHTVKKPNVVIEFSKRSRASSPLQRYAV